MVIMTPISVWWKQGQTKNTALTYLFSGSLTRNVDNLCQAFFGEMTYFQGWKGVALVAKWRIEVTRTSWKFLPIKCSLRILSSSSRKKLKRIRTQINTLRPIERSILRIFVKIAIGPSGRLFLSWKIIESAWIVLFIVEVKDVTMPRFSINLTMSQRE